MVPFQHSLGHGHELLVVWACKKMNQSSVNT
jgi:hypothetical protein